ncbi:D-alanyl-D-alanine carboxypeptidase family protein [Neobacillus vireti]|uniref:D-alanyl-D-alanine carboxypeptidase n=1 Tax=Neobacillus vireti LMG 21834 TaxID=1131730 RepID=A0AB94ILK4_9BACI|nr:D-alanyl-D-alanine carboxypeptidase family protein [Neobacillus vireti]ETI67929.1 D-alanyl-D-alanine carboxypeptidase [Neobacillus vireti LMG 21834]
MNKFVSFIMVVLLLLTNQLTANAAENQQLALKSEGVVLLDSDTGVVLYAKNAEEKMYPASLTKIATAIYAIEKGNLDSIVTVSANAVNQDGTRVYLNEGEQVPLKKLIQGMLINSGNDAAVAIAEYMDGTVEHFGENLNEYLKSTIGVKNTHFINPNGLFDQNHYTTAMDLALMTNYAIKNPVFSEIFGTKRLEWEGQSWKTTLFTHHRMLKGELPYDGITGGKTGYTTEAKQTLATTADNGKIRLTAVVLKSEQKRDKYDDTALLFDYGFKAFQQETIKQGEIFKEDNKEFYPENDTIITESVDGCIKNVDSNGMLSIENKNGQVIQSIQLKYNEPPKPKVAAKKIEKPKESEKPLLQVNVILGFMIIAFIGILIGIRKKINRKF